MKMKSCALTLTILLLAVSGVFSQQKETPASAEIINDRALNLPEPVYPAAARAVQASGAVRVQVTVDENGDVVSAFAVSGHPLLRAAAANAARQAKFVPGTVDGKTAKFSGTLLFIFMTPEQWQFIGEALGDAEVEIASAEGLQSAAEDLESVYPEIARAISVIAGNFTKDEQAARFQTSAIGDAIGQIQNKLYGRGRSLWFFELGLAVGRIRANYFDEPTLRVNLGRLKELAGAYPATENRALDDEQWAEELTEIIGLADREYFSRKDKLLIKRLIEVF